MGNTKLVYDVEKCVGCRVCELVCSFKHEGTFNTKRSRIRVTSIYPAGVDLPISCHHCESMMCAASCPQEAITKDVKTGAVVVDDERCIGCMACLSGCPIRAIYWDPTKRKVIKCDLCAGDPTCAKYCAHGALKVFYGEEDMPVLQDILREFLKGDRGNINSYLDELDK
ncbi:MAG: 4Fe-4S dicluster domain-containing protein [Parabacteroides sp.]|nr:4Fe-4S dicluster domain-containing protein [Eubacteriales bacterium]MDD4591115.1 4Fe-4S dicluster domain-containing protein [Parabacteroides sp.]